MTSARASARSRSDATTDGDRVAEDADALRHLRTGGVLIDHHLATLPSLTGAVVLRSSSPHGEQTGAMWRSFWTVTRARVAEGGDAAHLVQTARQTFGSLASWCGATAAGHHPVEMRRASTPATNGASA